MKKFPVIALVVFSVAFAGLAEAAKSKKRTRNANRVGAYGAVFLAGTRYKGDQSLNEQQLIDVLTDPSTPSRNVTSSTKDTDIGYQATFGYRFNRYFAAELGLAQYGQLSSSAKGELDFGDGRGFVPTSVELTFNVGGPILSAVGILPLGEKFELYARLGYLFASSDREFSSRVDGVSGVAGTAKGDSQEPVYGIGAAWNINQIYSIHAEYQMITKVGQASRTGTEDLDIFAVGLMVRF